ncbi:MAG: aminotransferase class IV, partial [Coriobacteriia bacterium]|nr:aminotransferase class IV [Coriobacteriia bacterium]
MTSAQLCMALRETIRVHNSRIPLLDRHLARLRAGGCNPATVDRARDEALRAAAAWSDPYGRMSLVVDVDGSTRAEISNQPSTIDVPGGPRIALVETDEPQLPPGAAKPADRSFWDRALAAVPEADVAVLVSREGRLIDTSQATLWLRSGNRLLTPPSPPALAGVSRSVVFDLAPSLGFIAEE